MRMKLDDVRKSLFELKAIGCSEFCVVNGNDGCIQFSDALLDVQSERIEEYTKYNEKQPSACTQDGSQLCPVTLYTNGSQVTDWALPIPWKTEINESLLNFQSIIPHFPLSCWQCIKHETQRPWDRIVLKY